MRGSFFPGSGIRDPGTGIRDPGTGIREPGSGIRQAGIRRNFFLNIGVKRRRDPPY